MNDFDKPILTSKEEKYRSKVQSKIENCIYCQPYDGGEVFWILGDRIELMELLEICKVPEINWEIIVEHLHCPYCGNISFDLASEIGIKTEFDIEVDKHLAGAKKMYGSLVIELEELLEKFPLLAYSNKLAKRIFKEIKDEKLPKSSVVGEFYRARKAENSVVITNDGMFNPPIGKPTEGRFNHSGQSHLYMSNNKSAAIKEVVSEEPSLLVWCQKFEIKTKIENVLDLSFDWDSLSPLTSTLLLALKVKNTLGRNDRNKELWRPDYYLTRFIMDCAKKLGYNGIKYNSAKHYDSFNIVLFYPNAKMIIPIGAPQIEIFMDKQDKEEFNLKMLEIYGF